VADVMLWWATRSTALVALVLLGLTLALGVLAGSGSPRARVVLQQVHRTASMLAVLLVGVHVATVVADPHVDLGLVDVVVPFGSSWHVVATGLGTLALDLLVAIALTSALRSRLPGPAWRAVHVVAYACWPIAAVHALGTGTDRSAVMTVVAATALVVLPAVAWRLTRIRSHGARVGVLLAMVALGALVGAVGVTP
jgi:sulfoxide reductase heme-binding subunit YedZ